MSTRTVADATSEPEPTVNSKWWYWIAAQPISAVLIIIAAGAELGGLAVVLFLFLFLAYFIGLFAYAADIKAIANTDGIDWNPSRLVYIGLAFFFGLFVALFYLYKRHKHVGVP